MRESDSSRVHQQVKPVMISSLVLLALSVVALGSDQTQSCADVAVEETALLQSVRSHKLAKKEKTGRCCYDKQTCPSGLLPFAEVDGCNPAPPMDRSGCSDSEDACMKCGENTPSSVIFCEVGESPEPEPTSDGRCCYDMESCPTDLPPFSDVGGCNYASPKDTSTCSESKEACAACGESSTSTSVYCPVSKTEPTSLVQRKAAEVAKKEKTGRCCYDKQTCPSGLLPFAEVDGCNPAPPMDRSGCSDSEDACMKCGENTPSSVIFCEVGESPTPEPTGDGRCCYDMDSCPTDLPPFSDVGGCNYASPKDTSACSESKEACAACGESSTSTSIYCPVSPK